MDEISSVAHQALLFHLQINK